MIDYLCHFWVVYQCLIFYCCPKALQEDSICILKYMHRSFCSCRKFLGCRSP